MTAYAFFELTLVAEPSEAALASYEEYRTAVVELIARHGGRYLARAWHGAALEGAPVGDRFHLVEFPDARAASSFWSDPDYLALTPLRTGAVDVRAVLIAPDPLA